MITIRIVIAVLATALAMIAAIAAIMSTRTKRASGGLEDCVSMRGAEATSSARGAEATSSAGAANDVLIGQPGVDNAGLQASLHQLFDDLLRREPMLLRRTLLGLEREVDDKDLPAGL